jgi:hypothetical protein
MLSQIAGKQHEHYLLYVLSEIALHLFLASANCILIFIQI